MSGEIEYTQQEMESIVTDLVADAAAESPGAPAEETPQKEPAASPEPAAEAPEAGDPDDDDAMTLDELDARIAEALKKHDEQVAEEVAEEPDPDDPQAAILAENKRLKAELEAREKAQREADEQKHIKELEHSISSTIGKYRMSDAEIEATVAYMEGNPDLVAGGMGFEKAALRVHPDLPGRLKSADAPPSAPRSAGDASGSLDTPGANGNARPKAWRHTPSPGDYSDVTQHILASGEARGLVSRS